MPLPLLANHNSKRGAELGRCREFKLEVGRRDLASLQGPTAFVLGAGFSAAAQFPLVRGLRDRVLHYLEAEQHSAYRSFLKPGSGGFKDGKFKTGLEAVDPAGKMGFEELLIALSNNQKKENRGDDLPSITDRVLRIGCARLLWCIQNSVWRASSCYLNFATRLRSVPSNAIISFNWDLMVERMFEDALITWSYDLGAGIPVIKPHGSINWSGHLREGLPAEYPGWRRLGIGSELCYDPQLRFRTRTSRKSTPISGT